MECSLNIFKIDEIFINIIMNLPISSIGNLMLINKELHQKMTNYIWKLLYNRDYENITIEENDNIFLEKYVKCISLVRLKTKLKLNNEINEIHNLQKLDLHNSQITLIPSEIGKLINLQRLDLYNNQITSIPSEIGKLINL